MSEIEVREAGRRLLRCRIEPYEEVYRRTTSTLSADNKLIHDFALSLLDETPITRSWLRDNGWKSVPSDMGPDYADNMQIEVSPNNLLRIWECGDGEWLIHTYDKFPVRSVGQLRALLFALSHKEPRDE